MAKHKSVDPSAIRPKIFTSAEELSQGVEKLRGRIIQVEELKKDGLPYRDALKVTTEFQIRDTIREIFGNHSPEFHEHQHLRIKVSSKATVDETVSLLQHLILALEEKRMDLLGLRPRPPIQSGHHGNGRTAFPPATEPPASPPPVPIVNVRQPVTTDHGSVPQTPVVPPSPSAKILKEVPRSMEQEVTREPSPAPPPPPAVPVSAAPPAAIDPVSMPAASKTDPAPAAMRTANTLAAHHRVDTPESTPMPPQAPESASSDATPSLDRIRNICARFHSVARQLRQRREDRPTLEVEDESDVLEVLHTLLCVNFHDIQTETWTPAYAGGANRTDLVLMEAGIVIIAKKTRQGLGAKTLTDQMNVDVQRYAGHPHCTHLVCFLYDPEGRIGNPKSLETALRREQNGRLVEVIISPQ